jgi:hypothetical protein
VIQRAKPGLSATVAVAETTEGDPVMAYVYVLRSGSENLFKIGKTSDEVEDRRRTLSTGNPHRLTVFDVIETEDKNECEKYLHQMLRSKKYREGSAEEFFELTPEALKLIIDQAREFLPDFLSTRQSAELLADERSDDPMVTPDEEHLAVYKRLLEVREQQDRCEYERRHLENKLKLAIGTAAGLEGIASWKTRVIRRFDEAAFKEAESELYQAYVRTSYERKLDLRVSWTPADRDE